MIGLYSANSQAGVGFTGLLDEYGGAAAAYSVRRLSSTYVGSLVEVRRTVSAVTVTADVAYDSNNELSLDSSITITSGSSSAANLGEFVAASGYSDPDSLGSGADSFVRTWYDQSGNGNNAQQTTTSNQPQIVNSGNVILINGNPSLDFTNGVNQLSNRELQFSSVSSFNLGATSIVVRKLNVFPANLFAKLFNVTDATRVIGNGFQTTLATYNNAHIISDDFAYRLGVGYNADTNQGLDITIYSGGGTGSGNQANFEHYKDSVNFTPLNSAAFGANNYTLSYINSWKNNSDGVNGYFQEFIFYTSDQSSNRTRIESNINSYFNIYP